MFESFFTLRDKYSILNHARLDPVLSMLLICADCTLRNALHRQVRIFALAILELRKFISILSQVKATDHDLLRRREYGLWLLV